MQYQITVNGAARTVQADPGTPLLWVLRDHLDLTGTKFGCGIGACGACTIHLNGAPARACQTPIEDAAGGQVITIEGAADPVAAAVQAAWREKDVVQCGWCQSGQIMSAIALLRSNPKPDDDAINEAMGGNLCRCATYVRIKDAVKSASQKLEG